MSTATTTYDVRVGDVGTKLRGEMKDQGVAFNPTGATLAQIVIRSPSGQLFERPATITTTGAGASQKWFLEYTTVQADLDEGLHATKGVYYWQGRLEFSGGATKFKTDIQTYLVEANL